jgi:hypothetical protein
LATGEIYDRRTGIVGIAEETMWRNRLIRTRVKAQFGGWRGSQREEGRCRNGIGGGRYGRERERSIPSREEHVSIG